MLKLDGVFDVLRGSRAEEGPTGAFELAPPLSEAEMVRLEGDVNAGGTLTVTGTAIELVARQPGWVRGPLPVLRSLDAGLDFISGDDLRFSVAPTRVGAGEITFATADGLEAGKTRLKYKEMDVGTVVDLRFSDDLSEVVATAEMNAGSEPFLTDRTRFWVVLPRIGAEGIVAGLLENGALGLLTTHDLALASIADSLAPRVENVHFADHLEDGVMTFDYTLRPGVVRKSNALDLMRSVGLDV